MCPEGEVAGECSSSTLNVTGGWRRAKRTLPLRSDAVSTCEANPHLPRNMLNLASSCLRTLRGSLNLYR